MSAVNQLSSQPTDASAAAEAPAARRLITPALWSLGGYSAAQVIRLSSSLILTRYLIPEDYGVMAVATAVSAGVILFSDLGTNVFLIQHKNAEDPRYFNTAWTIGAVRGVVLWLATVLLGWPISVWYKAPILIGLVPALGFNLVLAGLNSTSLVLLTRRVEPARVVILNVTTAFLGTLLSVLFVVYIKPSVWGLVIGNIGSGLAFLALSHWILPGHRNSWCWDRGAAGELFKLSKWVFPSTIVSFFADQSDRLIVASLAGMHQVGLYHLAAQLCQLPLALLNTLGTNLLFPIFSEHVRNNAESAVSIRRARRMYLGFGTTMVIGLLLLGPTVAKLLFGSRFGDAGWMVRVLAIGVAFRSYSAIGTEYLKAIGHFRTHAITNAFKVPIVFTAPPILATFFGSAGLLAGFVLADAFRFAMIAYSLQREGIPGLRDEIIALLLVSVTGIFIFITS